MKLFSLSLLLTTVITAAGLTVTSYAAPIAPQSPTESLSSLDQAFATPSRGIPGRRESGGTR